MAKLSDTDLDMALRNHPDWRVEDGKLIRDYTFPDFLTAMIFVNNIAHLAESANHHPDIDIHYNNVRLALHSHDAGAITTRDLVLASRIDGLSEGRTT